MKTVLTALLATAVVAAIALAEKPRADYTAHEWGTFTSVQGGDGSLVAWQPIEPAELPQFVYDWNKPGLDRPKNGFMRGKLQPSLQRMETPVIYFYSDTEQSVDVSVDFPFGRITEWYPQAARIGPAYRPPDASPAPATTLNQSRIEWPHVRLIPPGQGRTLPYDASASHYFAARETDSAFVHIDALSETNAAEDEKFLFYRGVGWFATPLQVRMNDAGELAVTNNGRDALAHLFVLTLKDGKGTYFYFDKLASGDNRTVHFADDNPAIAEKDLAALLRRDMAKALEAEGLFPREAIAMVNTWRDSWFAEDGVRVLYVLPRGWTDTTLPMTLSPAPKSLARVMVGRAEVITPETERNVREQLLGAIRTGDDAARDRVIATLKHLGRFAEPTLSLALKGADEKTQRAAWDLFHTLSVAAAQIPPSIRGSSPFEN